MSFFVLPNMCDMNCKPTWMESHRITLLRSRNIYRMIHLNMFLEVTSNFTQSVCYSSVSQMFFLKTTVLSKQSVEEPDETKMNYLTVKTMMVRGERGS